MLVFYHGSQFAMSHGSYDSNPGSEILILVGGIRSRSWPNISGTYGTTIDCTDQIFKNIFDLH
jgi:hypothetical protein